MSPSREYSPRRPLLTGLVICQNSAATLERCLTSLRFCDERVVVDGGSQDQSVDIAKELANTVLVRPYRGTNDQKEFARSQARGIWVLNIDADEWVTPELAAEILRTLGQTESIGFRIPIRSWLEGTWLRRNGWYPNLQKRLFMRDQGYWDRSQEPHDRVCLRGEWDRLRHPIEHEPGETLEDLERKARRYGEMAGERLALAGKTVNPVSARLRPWWRYGRSLILKAGFLDRRFGQALARISYLEGYEKYKRWR